MSKQNQTLKAKKRPGWAIPRYIHVWLDPAYSRPARYHSCLRPCLLTSILSNSVTCARTSTILLRSISFTSHHLLLNVNINVNVQHPASKSFFLLSLYIFAGTGVTLISKNKIISRLAEAPYNAAAGNGGIGLAAAGGLYSEGNSRMF